MFMTILYVGCRRHFSKSPTGVDWGGGSSRTLEISSSESEMTGKAISGCVVALAQSVTTAGAEASPVVVGVERFLAPTAAEHEQAIN